MKPILAMLISSLFLTGCYMNAVKPVDIEDTYFHPEPSKEEAVKIIRKTLENTLFDPTSYLLDCNKPHGKGWARGDDYWEDATIGYVYLCRINAKNRFGAYTGYENIIYVINGNSIRSFTHSLGVRKGKQYDFMQ